MSTTTSKDPTEGTAIRPFGPVRIPDTELADLRRRINETRWPERETVPDSSQGVQLETMKKLVYYAEHDKGGHFAAWEQPNFLTEDLRAGFRPLRAA